MLRSLVGSEMCIRDRKNLPTPTREDKLLFWSRFVRRLAGNVVLHFDRSRPLKRQRHSSQRYWIVHVCSTRPRHDDRNVRLSRRVHDVPGNRTESQHLFRRRRRPRVHAKRKVSVGEIGARARILANIRILFYGMKQKEKNGLVSHFDA